VGDESRGPKSDHLLTKLEGGGWEALDWSPDDKKILLKEDLSINESYLWLVDTTSGEKTAFTPRDAKRKVPTERENSARMERAFTSQQTRNRSFQRLAYLDLATRQPKYLTTKIPWDVDGFRLSHDGRRIAFVTNEAGVSVLHDAAQGANRRAFTETACGRHWDAPLAARQPRTGPC
jgi:dipeptidyl aminopeptidase/acylaminoacyl peptidase